MEKYTEFTLYEELLGFFSLEREELLCKMNIKLPELSYNFYTNVNFVRNSCGEIVVFLNEYQKKIAIMHDVIVKLWFSRN